MTEKLKIIPLGGLNEIGKNMYVYEYAGDILVVDCGIAFPDDEHLGIDLIMPDISYLVKHKSRIRAIVITHGHEDHIGSIPYVFKQLSAPIYCTRLTAGLIEIKLQEAGIKTARLRKLEAGQSFKAGAFKVEFIRVNHSIADAVSLAITTPLGVVVHTGDFKIDTTPVQGDVIDLSRFGELGKKGVLALLSDSTNVERPGYTVSEKKVGESLDALFKGCDKRIIVTTFATNVYRLQQVIDSAARYGRKVAITGRSMENILRVAIELGYMNIPPNTIVEITQIKNVPKNKLVIVTTGSQGESMSALYRMAFASHRFVEVGPDDRIIVSASSIPGNEKTVYRMINELFRKGAEVIYEKLAEIHVSGHACQEELKIMLALTRPKYFMPMHGEYRHLLKHAELAKQMGLPSNNVFVSENGRVLEITEKSAGFSGSVPAGSVLIDGLGVGDVGSVVLKDRKHLSEDGLIVVVMAFDSDTGLISGGPDIVSRGFIYVKESEDLMEGMKKLCSDALDMCQNKKIRDWAAIKSALRERLSDYLYKKTKRRPMILPVIMEV